MRIFVAVRHSIDPKHYYGGLWSGNFYPALRRLGHELIESQVDLLPTSRFMTVASGFTAAEQATRGRTTQAILDEVKAAHADRPIDLFLSYFYASHFDPAGFDEIERLGIPAVNYFCNSIYQFELVAPIAARVRYSWHAERDARQSYVAAGGRPIWVQMAADPEVYHPVPVEKRTAAACFLGQRYADRDRWAKALLDANVPLALYGPGWGNDPPADSGQKAGEHSEYLGRMRPKPGSIASYTTAARETVARDGLLAGAVRLWKQVQYRRESQRLLPSFQPHAQGRVPFERQKEIFSAYDVILNFSNVWADGRPGSKLIPHVRLRDFEAPMCRVCYLTGHTDEIEEFYQPGVEIETYRSPEELVEKSRYYLAHPDRAEALREAGFQRARRDHTWDSRFRELFSKIGCSA